MIDPQKYNPFDSFRDGQKEAILELIDGYEDGVSELSASTGSGKSGILYCSGYGLMEQYGLSRVIYTTPQTSLVDQLEKDHFKGTAVLKGQQNYRCDLYPEELDVSSCPKRAAEGRKFQPCPECTYWQLRREFTRSRFGIATLDLVLSTKKLSDADVLIVDESSDLEMALLRHYEVSLPAYVTEKNMIEGLEQWHEEMEKKYKEIQIEVNELYSTISKNKKSMERFTKVSRQLLRTESHLQKVDEIIGMVNAGWPYLINEVKEGNDVRRKFKLVMGARLFNQLRDRYGYIILASGTPTTESLTKEYTKVVMPSPIPKSQRMVYYYTKIGKMSRDSINVTLPKVANKILEIYEENGRKNVLVHCHSYEGVAQPLYYRLHRKAPVILQSKATRESALEDFKAGTDNIYLSVNYAQGIDLKGDNFQTNIIAKVPYPYLGDAWVQKRKEADAGAWYNMTTAVAVQQACGRCTRGPTDYSKSYILDASFVGFLRRCKNLLQPWFVEALVKV